MIETLLSFSLATVALALSPGPDNIYVLTQSLAHGSKSGIATTAGLISGCIVHTALLAFGISALITASEGLFIAIKIIGAAYLLYLAFKVFRADAAIQISEGNTQKKSPWNYFKTGVIMNLLNPKVMLFFIAFFPAFLWNPDSNTVYQFFVLGGVFMGVSFIIFSAIALLAGSISRFIKHHKGVGVLLKWLQIIVFVGIAVFILIP
ncbi:MAG TPA: lysine transporter LysE [Flavobacteriaceae bacterium]|nr:lysine transporter LysE [Flavobacteriaceae bacterium]MAY52389.1 lysine transporter LysE [Flavobacteriaceae bacterium]HBR54955.1 lysine transporter LysE [Flavobacteriaceae bacterium]